MRGLISVFDKTGVVDFAKELQDLGVELISTGGTEKLLKEQGISVTGISEVTGFPQCFDGRVKTLHPKIHGGILAKRDNPEHRKEMDRLDISEIDLVVINLYPFKETIGRPDCTLEDAIENIDIGGPTMLRAAAKNHKDVLVVCEAKDYEEVLQRLKNDRITDEFRYEMALKVFQHTAAYDALIADYLRKRGGYSLPENPTFTYEKIQTLRYGENPHQGADYYREVEIHSGDLTGAVQLHGKELSFNNINDSHGALEALKEFEETAVVAVKHANPCGVATGSCLREAYQRAHDCDPVSIFGGIVACNRAVDLDTAKEMSKIFLEIVIAPAYEEEALQWLKKKKNIRLLELKGLDSPDDTPGEKWDMKKVSGGLLIQEADQEVFQKENPFSVVTRQQPTREQWEDMKMAMKVVKHTKSNGIVFVKDGATIAIGTGQTNRIWAVENAIKRCAFSLEGAVMASDAFFPFDDCVTAAAQAGIGAIIQPGGSLKDEDSIKKADETGMAMVFTGMRHFRH